MNAKTYSRLFFIIVPLMALIVIAINLLVDPQGAFRLIDVKGINHYVVKNNALGRVGNGYNLYLNDYETILLGTSRVQSGMDPSMDDLSEKVVFNGSLGDTELLEIVAEMEFILSHQPNLEEVYFGLDLHPFSKNRLIHSEYEASLFNPETSIFWSFLRTSLSSRTLEDITETVTKNLTGKPEKYWIDGHYHSDAQVDHRSTIENILTVYMDRKAMFGCFEYDESKRDALAAIFEKYAEKGIQLNLFISPQHAKNLLILEQIDSMETYYDWLRDMTQLAESINTKYEGTVKLWNFSGFNQVTTEPIVYGREQMQYYFETSHYRANIGEMIIKTMQTEQSQGDFGEPMTLSSIDLIINNMRSKAAQYKTEYPQEITDLERIANNTEEARAAYSCPNHS